MKLSEFFSSLERIAPMAYSEEFCAKYGAYDNSGILVDCKNEVKKAVFCLDLSEKAVEFARKTGADVIVTHHPAIYSKLSSLCKQSSESGAVFLAIESGISVVSMHLNLDAGEGGIDESLARGVIEAAAKASGTLEIAGGNEKKMYAFSCGEGGYGRVYDVAKTTAGKFKKAFDEVFGAKHTLLFADENREIARVASFCGAGADGEAVEFAAKNGADLIVSSDFKHHVLKDATERGMAVLAPTHYASEAYGFYKFYQKIAKATDCEFFADEALL